MLHCTGLRLERLCLIGSGDLLPAADRLADLGADIRSRISTISPLGLHHEGAPLPEMMPFIGASQNPVDPWLPGATGDAFAHMGRR
jgi:hypothetical protein